MIKDCSISPVVAEAKRDKKEVHMARVHGICVKKNYQLPEGNPGETPDANSKDGVFYLATRRSSKDHWVGWSYPLMHGLPRSNTGSFDALS